MENNTNYSKSLAKRIGIRLRAIKDERKTRYKDIVEKTSIGERTLRKIFNGYELISIKDLCSLATFFNISPYDLIREETIGLDDKMIKVENNFGAILVFSLTFLLKYGFIHAAYDEINPKDNFYVIMNDKLDIMSFYNDYIDFIKKYQKFELNSYDDSYKMFEEQICRKYIDIYNNEIMKMNDEA